MVSTAEVILGCIDTKDRFMTFLGRFAFPEATAQSLAEWVRVVCLPNGRQIGGTKRAVNTYQTGGFG